LSCPFAPWGAAHCQRPRPAYIRRIPPFIKRRARLNFEGKRPRRRAREELAREEAARTRKPRADGLRNRERLLEAAKSAFADAGPEVSLEEIARRAGVGIGTLYRHFPTRDAIVEAVYRREVEQLADSATRLLVSLSPGDALHQWMRLFVDYIATKKVIASALGSIAGGVSELYASSGARITAAVTLLVDRARQRRYSRQYRTGRRPARPGRPDLWQRRPCLGGKRAAIDRHSHGRTAIASSISASAGFKVQLAELRSWNGLSPT
jgi:AcrR family transcriptional regulator